MIENVSPKKFLGQHFLIDENISKKIVNSFSLKEFDNQHWFHVRYSHH